MINARPIEFVDKGAHFSPDRAYRYVLWRVWEPHSPQGYVAMYGVNPSKANETDDDMTIVKSCGFAKRWGYGGLFMLNPFAFVSTCPLGMYTAADPVGEHNEHWIHWTLSLHDIKLNVAAWGSLPQLQRKKLNWDTRIAELQGMITGPIHCLGRTKDGSPRHPSRIAYSTPLEVFRE